jgi:large subunit ribosomal protein L18
MKKKVKKSFTKKKKDLKKIVGTSEKPRLAVYRSHKHIYAQLIDDKTGHTLAFSSTDKDVSKQLNRLQQKRSFSVGQNLAKKSVGKQIQTVVFDHGRIQK